MMLKRGFVLELRRLGGHGHLLCADILDDAFRRENCLLKTQN